MLALEIKKLVCDYDVGYSYYRFIHHKLICKRIMEGSICNVDILRST